MSGSLGRFQMVGVTNWKGLTKDNHLENVFRKCPQKATDMAVQLLAAQTGKSLDTFLSQFPTKEFDDDSEYFWDVVGSSSRNIPLKEARDINGQPIGDGPTDVAGAGTTPFYLVFGEDWFAKGEVIVGSLNEIYPMRILEEPRFEGSDTVYKVELMAGNTDGIPGALLQEGERFSIEYAPVEKELSRGVGDVRYTSPISMRNEFSTIRIKHKVPGNKLNKQFKVGIPVVKDGKKSIMTTWMHQVEWTVEKEWNQAKNKVLAYGRSNRNRNGEYLNIGLSGEVIRMGAGLFEQMEFSNTHYYNTFNLRWFTGKLAELFEGKVSYGDRTVIVKTGERGLMQFSQAALQEGTGWRVFDFEGSKSGLGLMQSVSHATAPSGGAIKMVTPQITEFVAPLGIHVKFEVDPMYDDKERNKILHKKGGVAYSYRYDIMDMGSTEQPNIQKVAVKGQPELRGFQWGLRNPFTGQMNNEYMSYDEDSAVIHRMTTTGIVVYDHTRTMSLIPSVLLGNN